VLEYDDRPIVREISCDLRGLADGKLSFAGIADLLGGAQEFRGSIGEDELDIWVETHELRLGDLLRELNLASPWDGRVSVGGLVRVPFWAPLDWNAYAWGRVDQPAFGERQFDLAIFTGNFDAQRIEVREGSVVRGANTLSLAGFGVSLAESQLDDMLRSFTGSVDLELFEPSAILHDASPDVRSAADRVRLAQLQASFAHRGMEVRSGRVDTDLGGLVIRRGRTTWGPRELRWFEGLALDLDLSLAFENIAPLAAVLNQGEASGSLDGTVELRGAAVRPSGKFLVTGKGLHVRGLDLGQVAIEARADKQQLEVARLEIDGALGQASASGAFDYTTGVISNARLSARTPALDILTAKRASAALVVVDATVQGNWREPGVWAAVRAWNLEVGERSIEEIDLEGFYGERCAHILRLEASVDRVLVDAAGSVCRDKTSGAWSVALDRARLERDELDLALEAPLEVALSPEKLVVRDLCLGGSAGRAVANLSWAPDEQDVSIDASELYPMQLLRPFLPDGVVIEGVQGSLSLHRTPQSLQGEASLRVDDLRPFPDSPPASLAFRGQLGPSELRIQQLALSAPGHFGLNVSGRVPTNPLEREWLSDGPLELIGDGSVSDLASLPWNRWDSESTWTGEVRAAFRLSGTSSDVRGVLDANLNVMRANADSILERAQLNEFQFAGRAYLGRGIALDSARFAMPGRASAIIDGHLDLAVSPRKWLADQSIPWREAPIDIIASVSAQDLGFIASLSPTLRRNGGSLDGDLCLGGTLGTPLINGELNLTNGEVRLANALAAFENLAAHVEFEGRSLHLVSLSGDYGAAPFNASGTIEFAGLEPTLDLIVAGKGLLVAREEGLRLRADADFKLQGALSSLSLSGKVVLVEGRFSKEFALISLPGSNSNRRTRELELPFLRREPWANIQFDVAVTALKPMRIDTNVARGTVDPQLQLGGSGAAPRLSGKILIGSTRVKLPAATLEVTSGVMTFRGESSLAPDLDITATTRVRGFDITAQVGGTSVDPELLFTSSPPLSSEELAVLVLTGQLPESALSAQGGGAAAQTVAVYLGRDLLTRWLGVEEGNEDPISERLEFYRGAEVSQTGIESTEFIFRLTPNPKGKSKILFLRAEKDIYERVNFGVKLLFRFQ